MIYPMGNPYKRPNQRAEYQLFTEDYFSGADVNIYFGKIWVDEIVNLEFSMVEQVMPVYGYNSYVFDAVARGKRMISGSFTINYKRAGYLKTILEQSEEFNNAFSQMRKEGKISENDFEKYKLDEILKMNEQSFDEIATKFEDSIWGIAEEQSELIATSDYPFFPKSHNGFDIRISYGPKKESEDYRIKEKVDARKQYGDAIPENYKSKRKGSLPSTTADSINGVQLMGFTRNNMATGTDGQALTETYTFIARDLNGTMSYQISDE